MSTGSQVPPRRSWPEPAQFNEAVQNLATSMADRELQAGQPELGPLGLPMPYAGNFADVYKVHCPQTGNTWAVKFFKREVRDLAHRYRAISDHLIASQLPFMVDFRYLGDGVRIAGAWYPIVKMRWIEGLALNRFVQQSLRQPKLLDQLLALWLRVAARLRAAGIAHADLQHGNVLLVPAERQRKLALRLIDYDGMYVPALAGQQSGEVGHRAYQHPQRGRESSVGPQVDHFSHLAICCALRALRAQPELWERFDNGDNLLFTERDFTKPHESPLFNALWMLRDDGARSLAGHLLLATVTPLREVSPIDEIVTETTPRPLTRADEDRIQALMFGASAAAISQPVPSNLPQATASERTAPQSAGMADREATAASEMSASDAEGQTSIWLDQARRAADALLEGVLSFSTGGGTAYSRTDERSDTEQRAFWPATILLGGASAVIIALVLWLWFQPVPPMISERKLTGQWTVEASGGYGRSWVWDIRDRGKLYVKTRRGWEHLGSWVVNNGSKFTATINDGRSYRYTGTLAEGTLRGDWEETSARSPSDSKRTWSAHRIESD
jgi:hypothetical protein